MSREVRKVPPNWVHPKDSDGRFKPMHDQDFDSAAEEWCLGFEEWRADTNKSYESSKEYCRYYWQYSGNPPDEEEYRPKWSDEERTHFMMYETTSEGTPLSPAFITPEELAQWLTDNKASAFGSMTASYEQWLAVARGGYAPSMVVENGVVKSGVEFVGEIGEKSDE